MNNLTVLAMAVLFFGGTFLNNSVKANEAYSEADLVHNQEEFNASKTILKWVHVDADVDWESLNYPVGIEKGDNELRVCFYEDEKNVPRVGKVLEDGRCLYAIEEEMAEEHASWRKHYRGGVTRKDYYILAAGDLTDYYLINDDGTQTVQKVSEHYLWVSNGLDQIELNVIKNAYRPLNVSGLGVCIAENRTFRPKFKWQLPVETRGWHPGKALQEEGEGTAYCYYEYGDFGDRAPSVHTIWSRGQIKLLYVRIVTHREE